MSLNVFGSASLGKDAVEHLSGSNIRHDSKLGAGAGLNYHITRNVGIGADVYSDDTTGAFSVEYTTNLADWLLLAPPRCAANLPAPTHLLSRSALIGCAGRKDHDSEPAAFT